MCYISSLIESQAVADAYYVLSDPKRRKEYDALYNTRADRSTDPNSSSGFFSQFASMFTGASTSGATGAAPGGQPDAEGVFADVFEEVTLLLHKMKTLIIERKFFQLLRPEVERHAPWWSWLGTACGGGVGFIIANIPGLMLGAYAGNRLGAVRDAKGKSVAAVFSELGGNQKAEVRFIKSSIKYTKWVLKILRALAMKVLGSAL